ncbi:MAG: protein phosphatase 2C domain-containing protein [Oscillospiraceae bacterium]|nr:protein phosphatase 2C domain-containing protein [Oscillospiraceae bacterium]
MIHVIDAVSIRGGKIMEDRMGWGKDYAFVIDGATGLTQGRITSFPSDAAWLAERMRDGLSTYFPDPSQATPEIFHRIADSCRTEFEQYRKETFPNGECDYPSAGFASVRIIGGELECACLGDCDAAVETVSGEVMSTKSRRVEELDRKAIDEMKRIAAESGCSMKEARQRISGLLLEHRALRNMTGGYWIFDPGGTGADHLSTARIPVEQVRSICLMTDGFAQAIQPFHIVRDLPDLFTQLRQGALADLLGSLLDSQRGDRDLELYPRLKYRDDTTVLYAVPEGRWPA